MPAFPFACSQSGESVLEKSDLLRYYVGAMATLRKKIFDRLAGVGAMTQKVKLRVDVDNSFRKLPHGRFSTTTHSSSA